MSTAARPAIRDDADLGSARRALETEAAGLKALIDALDGPVGAAVARAIETIRAAKGRVIVSGIGKSGHIGAKIAATFASTGTPAYFVHPSEASHGDLGMIAPDDVVIALSWSGESQELAGVIAYTRRFRVKLIAVTSRADSTLGQAADVVIALPPAKEACPNGLAPTTSTLMQLALGDAIAIALLEGRGFTAEDFRVYHPGGKLGASLKRVRDVMHGNEKLPLVALGSGVADAILQISQKSFGCVGVLDAEGRLAGIITDGDLRRHLGPELLSLRVEEIMTKRPKTVRPDLVLGAALDLINSLSITALFVVEADLKPIGIVHMHDLLRTGVA
jgi:arabinose-5-phosphate isomerase